MTVDQLIHIAYDVNDFQVIGGPDWIRSERYDIEAKPDESAGTPNNSSIQLMLQTLLEDRFKLVVRRETRDLPVYLLTAAKGGPKTTPTNCVKRDTTTAPNRRPSEFCGYLAMDNNVLMARGIDSGHFADELAIWVKRKVIDKTDLQQRFDVSLRWNPDETAPTATGDAAPSIFTALQEQLGLKLENSKGPVEVLVIDSAERPSEN
jgi:uncharacterized protein (TIGR03435 family)